VIDHHQSNLGDEPNHPIPSIPSTQTDSLLILRSTPKFQEKLIKIQNKSCCGSSAGITIPIHFPHPGGSSSSSSSISSLSSSFLFVPKESRCSKRERARERDYSSMSRFEIHCQTPVQTTLSCITLHCTAFSNTLHFSPF
jgi:hypothetical protein